MNCQCFEELLFKTTTENNIEIGNDTFKLEMLEHSNTCDTCHTLEESWKKVHTILKFDTVTPETISPKPGFTKRWREKVIEDRIMHEKQQTWYMLSLFTCGAIMTLSMITGWFLFSISTPGEIINIIFTRLLGLASYLLILERVILSITSIFPTLLVVILVINIFFLLGLMSCLWVTSLQKMSYRRKIV